MIDRDKMRKRIAASADKNCEAGASFADIEGAIPSPNCPDCGERMNLARPARPDLGPEYAGPLYLCANLECEPDYTLRRREVKE